ncbi:MAG: hypothetical protein ACLTSL_18175 [Odoribacter splanchnicus]
MEPEHSNFLWDYLNEFVKIVNNCQEIDIDDKTWENPKDFMVKFSIPKIAIADFCTTNYDYGEGDEDNGMTINLSIYDWQQKTDQDLQYTYTDGGIKQIIYKTKKYYNTLDYFTYLNGKPDFVEDWKNSHRFY